MEPITVQLRKPVAGIRKVEALNAYHNDAEYKKNRNNFDSESRSDEYEHSLKQMQDQLRIMEIELQKAREQSFQAGYDEGRERVRQEVNEHINNLERQLSTMHDQYVAALMKMDEPLLKLALMMAKKVIGLELNNPNNYERLLKVQLKKHLEQIIDQKKVVVQMNPELLQQIQTTDFADKMNTPNTMQINYVGDETLRPGECKIKTEGFYIDCSFEMQLENIEEELKNKEVEWNS